MLKDIPLFIEQNKIASSANSPDSLPLVGYSFDQLKSYLKRQLGAPIWNLELTEQHLADAINDALALYSLWKPLHKFGALTLVHGQKAYLENVDVGQGVAEVTFVENRIGVLDIDIGNPFIATSIITSGLGLDGVGDFAAFLNWQKTWMRVTSTQPNWQYDDWRKILWIHNPITRYRAVVLTYNKWAATELLKDHGAWWVKEYALAKARYMLGDLWMKFGGAIPGPAKDVQMDAAKRDKAEQKIKELEENLRASQDSTPLMID